MSAMSRHKGKRGELQVVALLRRVFPDARRRCAGEESQGERGRDIDLAGFCVQVQTAKSTTPVRKFREAVAAARSAEIPLAFTREASRSKRGEPWLVTLEAEALLDLLAGVSEDRMRLARDRRSSRSWKEKNACGA
jgi:hypothetical protein